MSNCVNSFGTLLKIGDGGGPETFTTIAEVLDINGPSLAQGTIEVTNHSSTGRWDEFCATTKSPGEISFPINFIPTEDTHDYPAGLINDLDDGTLRNFQLVFPDTGATTWTLAAYVTGFTPQAPVKGRLTADVTLQLSGQPTLA